MSNYTKSTNFATKDNLTPGDPLKIVRGTEIDTEYNNIATAIATKTDNSSAAITGGTINATTIGATTASTGAFSTLSATGAITSTLATGTAPLVIASTTKVANLNVDSLDGADWASPAALGSTTPAAVSATTLTTSSTVTFNGGTANGVAYLNGSKVLTSGSALTFDGTGQLSSNRSTDGNGFSTTNGTDADFLINMTSGVTRLSPSTGILAFGVSSTEQMRLTSTGLGIGTSSPAYKLHVESGATAATSYFSSTATPAYSATAYNGGNARIAMNGGGASGATTGINFSQGGSFEAYFGGVQESGGAAAFVWQGYNGSAYAERMRLDSSGNLGLGVTPSAWVSTSKAIQIGATGALWQSTSGFTFLSDNAYVDSGATNRYITTNFSTLYRQQSGQHNWFTAASGTAGNAITFTQAMTLDASGNLLVGTTTASNTPSQGITLMQNTSVGSVGIGHASGTSSGNGYLNFAYNGSAIGSVTQDGTTAVLYNTTSDQRLKENIQDADSASSLIDSLQVRQFDWKSDGSHTRYGFVAQELVTVAPEAVHQPADTEEMMAVDYSKLVPMLVKEIQFLRKRLADAGI